MSRSCVASWSREMLKGSRSGSSREPRRGGKEEGSGVDGIEAPVGGRMGEGVGVEAVPEKGCRGVEEVSNGGPAEDVEVEVRIIGWGGGRGEDFEEEEEARFFLLENIWGILGGGGRTRLGGLGWLGCGAGGGEVGG